MEYVTPGEPSQLDDLVHMWKFDSGMCAPEVN